jgi:bifunctional DNA-binding transcriptional regulator/antitoxin component of YhaV-PrlF toxin-antitoxin module
MQSKVVKVSEDGTLLLPDELREFLKDQRELAIAWNENAIVIQRKSKPEQKKALSKEDKINGLFEIADDLAILNEVAPISEEEMTAEIEAYRVEKRAQ